jgi:tRNA A58 N-methylase Trm61
LQFTKKIPSYILDEDIALYFNYASSLSDGAIVVDTGTGLGKSAVSLAMSNSKIHVYTYEYLKYPIERGWTDSETSYKEQIKDLFNQADATNYTLFIEDILAENNSVPSEINLFHLDGETETEVEILNKHVSKVINGGYVLVRNYDRILKNHSDELMEIALLNNLKMIEESGKIRVYKKFSRGEQ